MSHVAQSQLKGLWQWADKERKTLVRQVYSYTRTEKHTRLITRENTYLWLTYTYTFIYVHSYIYHTYAYANKVARLVCAIYIQYTHT